MQPEGRGAFCSLPDTALCAAHLAVGLQVISAPIDDSTQSQDGETESL